MERELVLVRSGSIVPTGTGPEAVVAFAEQDPNGLHGIADFDVTTYLTMRGLRTLSRASLLACVAAAAALEPSDPLPCDPARLAVVVGTRWASLEPLFEFEQTAALEGPALVNPSHFPNVVVNAHAGYLGILFGLAGPNLTVCSPSAGLEAVAHGLDLLELDRADCVLAGGVDALGENLSRVRERGEADAPSGEGAAFVLLARASPTITASVRVTALVSAAVDPALPNGGRTALVERALADAGVTPEEVAMLWLAGEGSDEISTPLPTSRFRVACGGANGVLALVAALHSVRGSHAPALAADLPATGMQRALVLAPA